MADRVRWDDLTPLNENNSGYEPEMEGIVLQIKRLSNTGSTLA
jgi:hypothetical protein